MTGFGRTGAAFAAQRSAFARHAHVRQGRDLGIRSARRRRHARIACGVLRYARAPERPHLQRTSARDGRRHRRAARVSRRTSLRTRPLELERLLRGALEGLRERHRAIGEIRGVGAFFGIELVADHKTRAPLVPGKAPVRSRRSSTICSRTGSICSGGTTSQSSPPLVSRRSELDEGVTIIDGRSPDWKRDAEQLQVLERPRARSSARSRLRGAARPTPR